MLKFMISIVTRTLEIMSDWHFSQLFLAHSLQHRAHSLIKSIAGMTPCILFPSNSLSHSPLTPYIPPLLNSGQRAVQPPNAYQERKFTTDICTPRWWTTLNLNGWSTRHQWVIADSIQRQELFPFCCLGQNGTEPSVQHAHLQNKR